MPDKLADLLKEADYISVLTIYGLAAIFGFIGGLGGSSLVLIKMGKFHRRIALALGLAFGSAIMAIIIFSGIFSYQFFTNTEIISDVQAVIHISVVTGAFTSVMLMGLNRGLSKLAVKYKGLQIDLDFKDGDNGQA